MLDSNPILSQIVDKARIAQGGNLASLTAGEQLAVSIVLDRPDWLRQAGYTIPDALDRLGPAWVSQLPAAAKQLAKERAATVEGLGHFSHQQRLTGLLAGAEPVLLQTKLSSIGSSPGYRDVDLHFIVEPLLAGVIHPPTRVGLRLRPEDAEAIVRRLTECHRDAWRPGQRPYDASPEEEPPHWLATA